MTSIADTRAVSGEMPDSRRVLRITKAYSAGRRSMSEVLALAAAQPEGSTDPVDTALRASLQANAPGLQVLQAQPSASTPATRQRRYSKLIVEGTAKRPAMAIIRGDAEAVMDASTIASGERGPLLTRIAELRRSGQRPLAVATAPLTGDGRIGEYTFEGVVGVKVESTDSMQQAVANNPTEWVRVRLWSRRLRIQHWVNLVLIVALTFTGYLIMQPGLMPTQAVDGESGYAYGWVRLIHVTSGVLWIGLGVFRTAIGLRSRDRQLRLRSLWPLRTRRDWQGLGQTVQYYAFLRKEPPTYIAHNPLQQLSYTFIYAIGVVQMLTGLSLFGLANQYSWFWRIMSSPVHLMGIPAVRLIHTLLMFVFWAFVVIHVYLAVRADSVERHGGVSSMINGGVWLRRGAEPLDGPKIG